MADKKVEAKKADAKKADAKNLLRKTNRMFSKAF